MAYVDPNCRAIAAKAANGSLTEAEILDAFARIDARKRSLQSQGAAGIPSYMKKWALEEGDRTRIAAAMKARHAALNVMVRKRVDAQVAGMMGAGLKPHQALRAVLEGINSSAAGSRQSVDAAKQGYVKRYLGGLFSELEAEKPHLVHALADEKLDNDLLVEMWELRKDGKPGSTGNADAQWLAKKFADYAEMSRTDLNRLGASIGKLDGWAGVQVHDPIKMIQAGKDAWVGRTVTLLDHERTFPEGVTQQEAIDILGGIYDTLITGVPNKATGAEKGQRVNPANLAKSLGASRVLHFMDAKASLSYRDQFGYGNTIAGMFQHLRSMGEKAGAMETLGPNPEVMFRAIAATLERQVKESKTIPDADKPKLIQKLTTDAGALKHAIDVTTGLVSRPVNVNAAKIGSDIRALQSMSKLGAALASSIPDTITAAAAAQFRGANFVASFGRQIGGIMQGRPRKEQGEISYLLGEGFDGMLGHIVSNSYASDGPIGFLGKMQEGFFKWNGLTWWTDVGRSVAARTIGAELGMHSGTAWAALPAKFRHVLAQAGFTADEWGVLGKAVLRLDNGKPYLTPDRIREISDVDVLPLIADRIAAIQKRGGANAQARIVEAIADARRQLEVKMLGYVSDQTSFAVLQTDSRTRRYTTLGQRPGTLAGEAVRFIMQFKGYPAAFTTRVIGRAVFGQRKDATGLDHFAHMSQLVAGLIITGYASMVLKDTLKGYWPPRNPADPRTILAAAQQSGALGIYGDFLFSKVNRFGGGLTETLMGPTLGTVGDFADIVMDARDAAISGGDDSFSGARAFSTVVSSVPYANLHLLKPTMDYMILNSLREAISPGYMRKQAKSRQTEYGQMSVPLMLGAKPALDPLNITPAF